MHCLWYQRYSNYFQDLQKKGEYDEDKTRDLAEGAAAMAAILARTNAAVEKVRLIQEVEDLKVSVDDWKGHQLPHFGALVRCGSHTVLKGEGQKEVERDVRIRVNIVCDNS